MGCINSKKLKEKYFVDPSANKSNNVMTSYNQIQNFFEEKGLGNVDLIFATDFSEKSFKMGNLPYHHSENLHKKFDNFGQTPFEKVVEIFSKSLDHFSQDNYVYSFGFNDSIFPLKKSSLNEELPCIRYEDVQETYENFIKKGIYELNTSNKINLAPIIYKALEIVKRENSYHLLCVVITGNVSDKKEAIEAIEIASRYPLNIVCVGVGRGPWKKMNKMSKKLPVRNFENFHFFKYHKIKKICEDRDVEIGRYMLDNVFNDYEYISKFILKN